MTAAIGAGALSAMRFFRQRNAISFYGTSVVITGGSHGLGLALARELAAERANLTNMARDTDEVERVAQDLPERGARVLALRGDVRDHKIAQEAIDRAVAHYGCVDVLITNAGIIQTGPVEHMTIQDFEDAMVIHLWGPLYTTRAALPYMRRDEPAAPQSDKHARRFCQDWLGKPIDIGAIAAGAPGRPSHAGK